MVKEYGMPSPLPPSYKGAGSRLGRPAQPIRSSEAQGIRTDLLPQSATARFPASTACHLHGGHVTSVGVLGTGVPRLACLRPAAWLKREPSAAHLHQVKLKDPR